MVLVWLSLGDLEWLSEIFNDTKHGAVSVPQLSSAELLIIDCTQPNCDLEGQVLLYSGRYELIWIAIHLCTDILNKYEQIVSGIANLAPSPNSGSEFYDMIPESLRVYSESFVTIAITVFLLPCHQTNTVNPLWVHHKNLAIANRLRVSCAHNMPRTSMITPWPWNLVNDHSRSAKTEPLSRSYTTYY